MTNPNDLKKNKIMITSALPYANGPLHFGHLTGVYLPADLFTRHLRLRGKNVAHISGSDEHGVAIMFGAEKEKQPFQDYVDFWNGEHRRLFSKYQIHFDYFGRTSDPGHHQESQRWFTELYQKGFIEKRSTQQLYSLDDACFLPDRYVEGTCYRCQYTQARGDECPNCGEWIDAIRLIQPKSKISGSTKLEIREVDQFFLLLSKLAPLFETWFQSKSETLRPLVRGFVQGLLKGDVVDRAISRDLSWGVDIPLPDTEGKKLYVWFDAPIGYLSNTRAWLKQKGLASNAELETELAEWWNESTSSVFHFIGKDNIIFHAYIFPAMMLGSGFASPPADVPAQEFLNLEGRQFSKSQGWTVDAEKAIDTFGPDVMRWALLSLIPEKGDTSFTWKGFELNVNELANKIGNFSHRSLSFIRKNFAEGLSPADFQRAELKFDLIQTCSRSVKKISDHFDQIELTQGLHEVLELGSRANEFFHKTEVWKVAKDRSPEGQELAKEILAGAMIFNLALATVFAAILPELSCKYWGNLGNWSSQNASDFYSDRFHDGAMKLIQSAFRLEKDPVILLPKIDPAVIAEWEAQLKSMALNTSH